MKFLQFLFYPNPANASYTSPKALALLIVCALLVLGSFWLKRWRRKQDPVAKKLSRNWSSVSFWLGLIGLFLIVARVETISYVSMRLWWLFWFAALVAYVFIQVRMFKARHYEILPKEKVEDPREKYLPGKK